MLYVSEIQRNAGKRLYGITDTDDGVTEYYTSKVLSDILKNNSGLQIEGIANGKISVVSMGKTVIGNMLDQVKSNLHDLIYSWDYQACENVARKGSFVREIKPYSDNPDEYHKITLERVLPESVQDVIKQSNEYTNQVHSVDVADKNAVIDALKNNMCLILQLGSKGIITLFIGTANLNVVDSIYGVGYFETFYLTKNLFNYTYNIEKLRKCNPSSKPKNPSMKPVISGSLRFRPSGSKHDGADLDLSSPMYTVNLDNLVGLFILDNPAAMAKYNVVNEFNHATSKGIYNFDMQLWSDVSKCCDDGCNYFGNTDYFLRYVDTENLTKAVEYTDAIERFADDFDYIEKMRERGYSFY